MVGLMVVVVRKMFVRRKVMMVEWTKRKRVGKEIERAEGLKRRVSGPRSRSGPLSREGAQPEKVDSPAFDTPTTTPSNSFLRPFFSSTFHQHGELKSRSCVVVVLARSRI